MRHHLAGRVVAPVLALQENAGNAQLHDPGGLVGRQLPLEVDELALRIGELARELPRVRFEQAREAARSAPRSVSTSAGLAATDSTGVEMASGSLLRSTIMPRVGAQLEHAHVARFAFLLQEVVVQALQVERAPGERDEPRRAR